MKGTRLTVGLWLWRHGWWMPVSVALVATGAWLWLVDAQALRDEIAARVEPPNRVIAARPDAEDQARYTALRQALQPHESTTRQVQRLVEITQPHLAWRQAEFQHTEDRPLDLVRVQIAVPVSGEYRRLRVALDNALREMPNLSIDQVLLHRHSVGETQLSARIRFSLWMRAPSQAAAKGPRT